MKEIHPIIEWAVWGNLCSIYNLELVLLKGHLYIEVIMNSVLKNHGIIFNDNNSFFRKVNLLKGISSQNADLNSVVQFLFTLNNFRNKLAHDFKYDVRNGEIEEWSKAVLKNYEGKKFSNYTYRTKIVHAFSGLTKKLLEL